MGATPRISQVHSCVRIVPSSESRISNAIQGCINDSTDFQMGIAKTAEFKYDYQCRVTQSVQLRGNSTMISLFTTCEGNLSDEQLKTKLPDVYKMVQENRSRDQKEQAMVSKLIEGASKLIEHLDKIIEAVDKDKLVNFIDNAKFYVEGFLENDNRRLYGPRSYGSPPDLSR